MSKILGLLSIAIAPFCVGPLWCPALPRIENVEIIEDLEKEDDVQEVKLIDEFAEKMVRHLNERWIQEELFYLNHPEEKKKRELLFADKIWEAMVEARQKRRDRLTNDGVIIDHKNESAPNTRMGGHGAVAVKDRKFDSKEDEMRSQQLEDLCGTRMGETERFTQAVQKDTERLKSLGDVLD